MLLPFLGCCTGGALPAAAHLTTEVDVGVLGIEGHQLPLLGGAGGVRQREGDVVHLEGGPLHGHATAGRRERGAGG